MSIVSLVLSWFENLYGIPGNVPGNVPDDVPDVPDDVFGVFSYDLPSGSDDATFYSLCKEIEKALDAEERSKDNNNLCSPGTYRVPKVNDKVTPYTFGYGVLFRAVKERQKFLGYVKDTLDKRVQYGITVNAINDCTWYFKDKYPDIFKIHESLNDC